MISMLIKYPSLITLAGFQRKPNQTNDLILEAFITKTNAALEKKDFNAATSFAELAALRYGVPGLILYYQVVFEKLKQDKNEDEIIEANAHKLLTLLMLAEKLFPHETQAKLLILKHFPQYCAQNQIDWAKMKSELIELGSLKGWEPEVEKDANELYQACILSLQYGAYLGKPNKLPSRSFTPEEIEEGKNLCKKVLPALVMFSTNPPKIPARFLKKPDIITERFTVTTHNQASLDTFVVSPRDSTTPSNKQLHIIQLVGSGMCYQQVLDDMHLKATTLDCKVIGFNYRGVYPSRGEPACLDDLMTDAITQVQRLLDTGIPPEKIMLYGHSLGGYISTFVVAYFQQQGVIINLFNDRSLSTKYKHFESHGMAPDTMAKLDKYGWTRDAAAVYATLATHTRDYIVVRTPRHARDETTVDDKTIPHQASLHAGLKPLKLTYKSHKFHPATNAYPNYHSVSLCELVSNLDPDTTAWDYFCAFAKRVALEKIHYPTCFANLFPFISEPIQQNASQFDFTKLVSETRTAVSNEQFKTAHELALRALSKDTFTGLILYYFVGLSELLFLDKQHENIQSRAVKYLEFLLLAEKLSNLEPEAQNLVANSFPEYRFKGEINWRSMRNNLIQLAALDPSIPLAEKKAELLYQAVYEPYQSTHRVNFTKS